MNILFQFKALFSYGGQHEDELCFETGDIITLISKVNIMVKYMYNIQAEDINFLVYAPINIHNVLIRTRRLGGKVHLLMEELEFSLPTM